MQYSWDNSSESKESVGSFENNKATDKTVVLKSTRSIAVTIPTYQYKRFKPISILNTLHPYVTTPEKDNPKKKAKHHPVLQ